MQDAADLYRVHGPGLYRYALMILADHRDAEDVLQQVFTSILSKPTTRRVDSAEAYLRAAVRNAAYSLLRHRRTGRAVDETILEPVVPDWSPAEHAALEKALRSLPPDQREVVHLHVYEGMTFQEVANLTRESINTVAARYRYALEKMRKVLGEK